MAPKAKPTPHRLGPPPQLNSLKVSVVHQKFAKKVQPKLQEVVSRHIKILAKWFHTQFSWKKIPYVLDGTSDCQQDGAADAHISVLHANISCITRDIPWRVDHCLFLPDHHRHEDSFAERELPVSWLPPSNHGSPHSSHSE